jgi:transposase
MSKTFRLWKIDEPQFLPPTVQDFVAKDHLARFMVSLVTEELDLTAIRASYLGEKGQPPFHLAMMVALLLYAYCCGIYSSRRIAKACRERVDFMSIVALEPPDFRTICEFRKRHAKALSGLFVQVLTLCEKAGLVKLGHVALDGTKIKANASKHKAMSYERMEGRATQLEAEVAQWFADAEAADSKEDKLYGSAKQGDEMPDWVADKKRRAEKIRAAKAELEAEAKAAAEAQARAEAEAEEKRKAEGRKKPGKPAAPPSADPDPKAKKKLRGERTAPPPRTRPRQDRSRRFIPRGSAVTPVENSEETGWGGARISPHAPDRATGTSLGCRTSCNIATISGRLGKGREIGVEAKLCELDDKAFGPDFLGAAIEMIGTEILELGTVLEHVVDRGEERGRDGAGCLLRSTSTGKTMELGVEVAALLAPSGPGTLDQQGLEPSVAFTQPGGTALAGTLIVAWT